MTRDLIVALIERIERLPPAAQQEIVAAVSDIALRHEGVYLLNGEERADIDAALAEEALDLATVEEVEVAFARLGRA